VEGPAVARCVCNVEEDLGGGLVPREAAHLLEACKEERAATSVQGASAMWKRTLTVVRSHERLPTFSRPVRKREQLC
jgi:hypothetical protein